LSSLLPRCHPAAARSSSPPPSSLPLALSLSLTHTHSWQAVPEDDRNITQLMCEQLDFADVIVVNKAELVSDEQIGRIVAVLKRFNVESEVVTTIRGVVDTKWSGSWRGAGWAQGGG